MTTLPPELQLPSWNSHCSTYVTASEKCQAAVAALRRLITPSPPWQSCLEIILPLWSSSDISSSDGSSAGRSPWSSLVLCRHSQLFWKRTSSVKKKKKKKTNTHMLRISPYSPDVCMEVDQCWLESTCAKIVTFNINVTAHWSDFDNKSPHLCCICAPRSFSAFTFRFYFPHRAKILWNSASAGLFSDCMI